MAKEVIAIFDIGKTNKKILLFDRFLNLIFQEEQTIPEIMDEDGFSCDDLLTIEQWMKDITLKLLKSGDFRIKAVNFACYGASLVYLNEYKQRLTPVFNYLKPMPEQVLTGFYEANGGCDEFCRKTASPALGMLNSGLQILWLKKEKYNIFKQVAHILHFPQYLSFTFTGRISSEYTSIGCHTAMWDFDNKCYHHWLKKENIVLPQPVSNQEAYPVSLNHTSIPFGIGIHDSSSSLVPYLQSSSAPFILISTGTWCIFMNPFNPEPLTADQLKKDTLCYLSVQQKQVKSSRLFLGFIHDINCKRLSDYFHKEDKYYKKVHADETLVYRLTREGEKLKYFFREGVPADYLDSQADLSVFNSFEEAYHQLILDLTQLAQESLNLVIPRNDSSESLYISGGFARNELFTRLLASFIPDKKVFTTEIDNSTAVGAAIVMWNHAFEGSMPEINLGLKEVKPFRI